MTALPLLRVLLAIAMVSGLALKIAGSRAASPAGSVHIEHQLAAFLEREGFQVEDNRHDNDLHLVSVKATRGECRLLLAVVSPQGWHSTLLMQIAAPQDQVSFVLDGNIYKAQPIWRTAAHDYLGRIWKYAGISTLPVLGVVSSPACDLAMLSWRDRGLRQS